MLKNETKILSFLLVLCVISSCSTADMYSSLIEEDKLYVTRKYIGNYLDYRHTSPDMYGNPDLVWITTSQDSIYGKIPAFSKECAFVEGERLYLRRVLSGTGKNKHWVYQVENNTIFYRVNEYQNHNTLMVESRFNTESEEPLQDYFISDDEVAQELKGQGEKSSGSN